MSVKRLDRCSWMELESRIQRQSQPIAIPALCTLCAVIRTVNYTTIRTTWFDALECLRECTCLVSLCCIVISFVRLLRLSSAIPKTASLPWMISTDTSIVADGLEPIVDSDRLSDYRQTDRQTYHRVCYHETSYK